MHVTNPQSSVVTCKVKKSSVPGVLSLWDVFLYLEEVSQDFNSMRAVPKGFESLLILHISADYMQVYHIPMSWKPAQVQYDQHSSSSLCPNPAVGYRPSTPAPAEIMD